MSDTPVEGTAPTTLSLAATPRHYPNHSSRAPDPVIQYGRGSQAVAAARPARRP